jgi:catechol 2,3-dioxygenase-like lactoylglutathione lyase family enzyme
MERMTNTVVPDFECEQENAVLAVPDVAAAADFYATKLGFKVAFTFGDPPSYAGVNLGSVQIFLRRGAANPQGIEVYFVVGNADELCEFQRANGVEVVVEPGDREYGLRDYRVRDLNGYELSFGHAIYNGGPGLEIERVDVPARLEKRLAALLADLAAYKHMTVSSCLEEMLLHTNEGVGPHTKSQLRHIQKLKEKHGIDYDSHASYRFVERGR